MKKESSETAIAKSDGLAMQNQSVLPPLSGDKGGAQTPARQFSSARPAISSPSPARLRRRLLDKRGFAAAGLPLHPPWRAYLSFSIEDVMIFPCFRISLVLI
jgi:hypothetical protein